MGEPLNEYTARLEGGADSQRLRVPRRYRDSQGNVITHVTLIYGLDADGTPHEIVDTAGVPIQNTAAKPAYQWPAGTTIEVNGMYTDETLGNTTGIVTIAPAIGDEFIISALKLNYAGHGTAGDAKVMRYQSTNTFEVTLCQASGTSMNLTLPRDGISATISSQNIVSVDLYSRLIANGQYVRCQKANTANTETFTIVASLRSKLGLDPLITATGGTWA